MLVVAGDLHLSATTWAKLPQVRGDAYRSFEQIVEYACENEATALLLLGDIFDTDRPSAQDVEEFLHGIDMCKQAKVLVYAIRGNHDPSEWPTVGGYVQDLSICDPGRLTIGSDSYKVTGINATTPEELKAKLAECDYADILVLHQLIRGALPEIEGRQTWDLDPEWVPESVKLVLMGDLHEPWQDGKYWYTGSTNLRSISEPPEKSFLVVEEGLKVRRQPLKTRPVCITTVLGEGEPLDAARGMIDKCEPDTLAIVRFDPRIPDVESRLSTDNNHIHFLWRPISIATVDAQQTDASVLEDISLEGCLDLVVDREQDAEFHDFMLKLLKGKPEAVLEEYEARVLGTEVKDANRQADVGGGPDDGSGSQGAVDGRAKEGSGGGPDGGPEDNEGEVRGANQPEVPDPAGDGEGRLKPCAEVDVSVPL